MLIGYLHASELREAIESKLLLDGVSLNTPVFFTAGSQASAAQKHAHEVAVDRHHKHHT